MYNAQTCMGQTGRGGEWLRKRTLTPKYGEREKEPVYQPYVVQSGISCSEGLHGMHAPFPTWHRISAAACPAWDEGCPHLGLRWPGGGPASQHQYFSWWP